MHLVLEYQDTVLEERLLYHHWISYLKSGRLIDDFPGLKQVDIDLVRLWEGKAWDRLWKKDLDMAVVHPAFNKAFLMRKVEYLDENAVYFPCGVPKKPWFLVSSNTRSPRFLW